MPAATTFDRGVDFEYQPGQAYDVGAVIYTGASTTALPIPTASENSVFRVDTAIAAGDNTGFAAISGSLVAIGGSSGGGTRV